MEWVHRGGTSIRQDRSTPQELSHPSGISQESCVYDLYKKSSTHESRDLLTLDRVGPVTMEPGTEKGQLVLRVGRGCLEQLS